MTETQASPSQENQRLLVPREVEDSLPSMVRAELAKLPAADQEAFLEEFRRKSKSLPLAYLCSLLYCHYGFLGRWGMTVIMWLAAIVTVGIAGLIWWVIDLFRMPGLVRNHNRDVAVDVLRNFQAVRR